MAVDFFRYLFGEAYVFFFVLAAGIMGSVVGFFLHAAWEVLREKWKR